MECCSGTLALRNTAALKLENVIRELKHLFPGIVNPEIREEIAMQSSYVSFDREGEALFRPGDFPKGFYWILSGEVEQRVSKGISLSMKSGDAVGLEEFLVHHSHTSYWVTKTPVRTIFMDRRCFENFNFHPAGRDIISSRLSHQLVYLKEKLNPVG